MGCSRCSQCVGIEREFDRKLATKELQQYRNEGPIEETRLLIDALKAEGVAGMTLLDIGGGIGAIQHELLKGGVRNCIDVEVSEAYLEAVKKEARRQGHEGAMTHRRGDFVDLAANIPPCGIVTLDKVICCYHDVKSLVAKSAARARVLYGVVYPLNNWKARLAFFLENISYRLRRSPFRVFVHPTEVVEEILRTEGFEQRFYQEQGMWQIVVYRRAHPSRTLPTGPKMPRHERHNRRRTKPRQTRQHESEKKEAQTASPRQSKAPRSSDG